MVAISVKPHVSGKGENGTLDNLIGKFFSLNLKTNPKLKDPLESTIMISKTRNDSHGSGVIAEYEGEKYLVTASHVIEGDSTFLPEFDQDHYNKLKVFERKDGELASYNLTNLHLIYSRPIAYKNNLSVGDVAVFKYNGELKGINLKESPVEENEASICLGYPGIFKDRWVKDLIPVASFGYPYQEEKGVPLSSLEGNESFDLNQFVLRNSNEEIPEEIQRLKFSGVTSGGNSGGGIFNLEGELIAVAQGHNDSYSVYDTFKELEGNSLL